MPRPSVWFVRTALVYLGVGATLGALVLWQKGTGTLPLAWRLRSAHLELALLGWTLQLAMGVAFWILPRLRVDGRPTRGRERAVWWSYGLLNAGLLTVAAAGADLGSGTVGPATAAAVGRWMEAAAVALFAWHAWPRVKPAGGGPTPVRSGAPAGAPAGGPHESDAA